MMKTMGLLGGMSWESTVTYYQLLNRAVKEQLGGFHSAKIVLYSVDFQEIEACQANGDWEKSAQILTAAARSLEAAGAGFIVICTNTMHKVASQIERGITIPLLHIAQVTAEVLVENSISKVALLGTKYTMTQDFYKQKLTDAGIAVIIPEPADIELVNSVIYNELCQGIVSSGAKREYLRVIEALAQKGAQGVILGCTEIGLLISQADTALPVFDTTRIHAEQAVRYALEK